MTDIDHNTQNEDRGVNPMPSVVDRSAVRGGYGTPVITQPGLNITALRKQRTPEEQQEIHERMEEIRVKNREKRDEAIAKMREENDKVMDRLRPEILIKYHCDAARPVEQAHDGEWFDVRAAKSYDLKAGNKYMIDLGISVRVPRGYEAILAPRSSSFKKWGFIQTNSIGVIDETYSGDDDIWMLPVFATRDAQIEAGERVAQFRIQRNQGRPRLTEVGYLGKNNRGGFGSTGTK